MLISAPNHSAAVWCVQSSIENAPTGMWRGVKIAPPASMPPFLRQMTQCLLWLLRGPQLVGVGGGDGMT